MKRTIFALSLLAIFQRQPAFTEQSSQANTERVLDHLDNIPDFPLPGSI